MEKYRKYAIVFSVIGLILILTGVTYSFFNYTRTGLANNFSVGNIYFNTTQNGNINLTNVFPITSEDLGTDVGNHDSVTISIVGSTDYSQGIEYLVSITEVNNIVNGKRLPMGFSTEVTGVGTSSDTYWEDRGGNSSIYTLTDTGKIKNGNYLLVGFIKSGQTGINGSITITAYVDANRLAITDTPDENSEWINGRIVFSTEEWASFQGNNALSFKIKVEANEGTWVRDPGEETPDSCFTTNPATGVYAYNNNRTSTDVNNCVTYFNNEGWSVDTYSGETMEAFCDGTGTNYGVDLQGYVDNGWFTSSQMTALAEYNILNNLGYTTTITDYDTSCGVNVVIPEVINTVSKTYNVSSNITQEQTEACLNFLGGELEWSNGSTGESLETFCDGTGTNWGNTMQDYLNDDYFGQYELNRLEETGVITANTTYTQANVISIDYGAFKDKNIQSLTLPEGLKTIGNTTFRENNIEEVIIPSTVTSDICGSFIFDMGVEITQNNHSYTCGCLATTENNDHTISIKGYDDVCPKDVVIPSTIDGKTVTGISYHAFDQKRITSVVIPDTVTTIGEGAFVGNNLTSVNIPNSVTSLGSYAFQSNSLTSITIPEGITRIPGYAFGSNNISSITFPSNLKWIENGAFSSNNLTTLVIPDGVEYIYNYAFSNNPLESLTLPSTLRYIDEYSLPTSNLTYLSTNFKDNTKIILPLDSINTLIIGSNVETAPRCTAYQAKCTIGTLTIDSDTLVSKNYSNTFNNKTFTEYYKITNLIIGDNVTSIGSYAFYNNTLSSVTLSDSVTSIGNTAFYQNQIASLDLGDGVQTIGSSAFYSNQLESVTIPNSVTTIGASAFNANRLTSITIPNNVTTIGTAAFAVNNLSTVTIGNGINTIGSYAFNKGNDSNANLSSITIDKSCSTIKAMTDYDWLSPSNKAGTTIYGSNNEVCDAY